MPPERMGGSDFCTQKSHRIICAFSGAEFAFRFRFEGSYL